MHLQYCKPICNVANVFATSQTHHSNFLSQNTIIAFSNAALFFSGFHFFIFRKKKKRWSWSSSYASQPSSFTANRTEDGKWGHGCSFRIWDGTSFLQSVRSCRVRCTQSCLKIIFHITELLFIVHHSFQPTRWLRKTVFVNRLHI